MKQNKPTVVLLHGAGLGAWVWERVQNAMKIPTLSIDVPGRIRGVTPDSCAEELVKILDGKGIDSIVLVLHSLSGVLAAPLTHLLGERLIQCIFVSGVIPPPGGTFVDALPFPNGLILRILFVLHSNGLKPSPEMIRRELCNDLSERDAESVISRYQPEMPGLYLKSSQTTHLPSRCTYIKLLADKSVPPPLQEKMIARLTRPRIKEIEAGHLAMLSSPELLASLILDEIGEVGDESDVERTRTGTRHTAKRGER